MIALCFVVAAIWHHPPRGEVLAGILPSLPRDHASQYWLYAVSIVGALIAPYLFYFYSSGAIEDEWDQTYLGINRIVAISGMTIGAVISGGLIIVAGMVLHPRSIGVDDINQAAFMLTDV